MSRVVDGRWTLLGNRQQDPCHQATASPDPEVLWNQQWHSLSLTGSSNRTAAYFSLLTGSRLVLGYPPKKFVPPSSAPTYIPQSETRQSSFFPDGRRQDA
jgi:hypothetical protein